jgi:hypothetical protein
MGKSEVDEASISMNLAILPLLSHTLHAKVRWLPLFFLKFTCVLLSVCTTHLTVPFEVCLGLCSVMLDHSPLCWTKRWP